jgi:hypothetical protein
LCFNQRTRTHFLCFFLSWQNSLTHQQLVSDTWHLDLKTGITRSTIITKWFPIPLNLVVSNFYCMSYHNTGNVHINNHLIFHQIYSTTVHHIPCEILITEKRTSKLWMCWSYQWRLILVHYDKLIHFNKLIHYDKTKHCCNMIICWLSQSSILIFQPIANFTLVKKSKTTTAYYMTNNKTYKLVYIHFDYRSLIDTKILWNI